ncbi:MAG: helix-turn-helix transcriptional regulator [Pirellulales bacterium]
MSADTLRIAEPDGEPTIDAEPIGDNPGPELPPALLMTVDDLARELRTSAKTIRRMDQAGRLPRGIKIGHSRRWARQTIIAWIAAGAPGRKEWEAFGGAPARRRSV